MLHETEENLYEVTHHLDAVGLLCPEPVMLLHNMIRKMSVGDILEVTATDPSTQRDIPKFCTFLNHELLLHSHKNGQYIYHLKKGATA